MILIDGNEYEITPFFGLEGWNIQTRLGSLIGPGVAELLKALPKGDLKKVSMMDVDLSNTGGAAHKLMESLANNDPDGVFVEKLLSKTMRNGALLTRQSINNAYAKNYLEMGKAIFAVIRENNFFGLGGSGFLSKLQNIAAESTES